jgi:hypothetical protein
MDGELYDEFGNYIGPDLDEGNEEDSNDDEPLQSEQSLESQIKQS